MNLDRLVDANPTKDFFIYMITRDIETRAAIIELIDNSIDGAKRIRRDSNYSGISIKIAFDNSSFTICDNCGGFDIETATKYAFKFGRPSSRNMEKGLYTGIFGIGMKRALFKLGNKFTVISTTEHEHFKIEVDVTRWIESDEWRFPMTEVVTDGNYPESERGTIIKIENLNRDQAISFGNKAFENSLISYAEKYRSVETENGLEIYINNNQVSFFKESLIENETIKCYRNYQKEENGEIRIIAGISHNGEPAKAGWYVFCNGRLVLFADKTDITGWGTEYRSYHASLASFRGYVYFESEDLLALPWNTTKTGVDITNPLYVVAKELMKQAVEQISSAINEYKKMYDVSSLDEIDTIKQAAVVRLDHNLIHTIHTGVDFKIFEPAPKEKKISITFSAPEEKFNTVKDHMKAKSKKEMGEKLFTYYYEMEEL